jgi:hypothetical protein
MTTRISLSEPLADLCDRSCARCVREVGGNLCACTPPDFFERRQSVAAAKTERRKATDIETIIEAYAARLATRLPTFPDPRALLPKKVPTIAVEVLGRVEGQLVVGDNLFDQNQVLAGDAIVAETRSPLEAQYVRAVLLHEPELKEVDVPQPPALHLVIAAWQGRVRAWQKDFTEAAEELLRGVGEKRTTAAIKSRALALLHAE